MESIDGNTAAAHVGYALSDAAFIYPITPSSAMGEYADAWAASGRENCFGNTVRVTEMQSEAGAAGAVHGSLAAGALTTTFTASQGLLLMVPNMYKIAGELMPCVFHVAARAVAGQALSIFGDHSDVMAVRQTGFALLSSHSVQEAMDLALVAHLASIKSSIPFVHFFEGFRLSHEISKIDVIPYDVMKKLIDHEAIARHHAKSLNPTHPHLRGTSQSPDIYFQLCEAANKFYDAVPAIVREVMRQVGDAIGRRYDLFEYVGHPEADRIIIMMGAGCPVVEETVLYLNEKEGERVGLLKVRLYRPWSISHFLEKIPSTVKQIAVLDRTKESGSLGEPLYLDVIASLEERTRTEWEMPLVVGGRFGLGSKDFTPAMAKAVFDNLKLETPRNHFTVGIDDDVTGTSLPVEVDIPTVPEGTTQCMFYGMGSDGTVGANKNAIKIIGEGTDQYIQGYFAYDAHKSGGVTVSHLRFGPKPITSQYLIREADYIAVHHPSYVHKYRVAQFAKKGAILVLNSIFTTLPELDRELPGSLKRAIAAKEVSLYAIDALKVARENGMGKRINNIMQTAFFSLSGVLPFDKAMSLFKAAIHKSYIHKGQPIVDANYSAVDAAVEALVKIEYDATKWAEAPIEERPGAPEGAPEFIGKILMPILAMEGDSLPVSTFEPGGFMPMGTSRFEKRSIAMQIPRVDPDKCTQCNYCSLVCPHAAIRPFLLTEEEAARAPAGFDSRKARGVSGLRYRIQVSPCDCTGCNICVSTCPDQALTMYPVQEEVEAQEGNWEFALTLPTRDEHFDRTTIKGSQFHQPLLEFSGACEGCGETPYPKLLTQLFGERMVIANATGCSSIWGGSAGFIPYTTNPRGEGPAWGNSLFEDNAEYGFGIAIAHLQRRENLARICQRLLGDPRKVSEAVLEKLRLFVAKPQDPKVCAEVYDSLPDLLRADMDAHPLVKEIYDKRDIIPKFSHWILGGDGWAYDIGYGGLDHVLASGADVNILVLDTEMYSNTGGQTSKATPMGSIAKFSSGGKPRQKKDLGQLAMTYGDVYVGSIALGASFTQCIRAMVEAESYPGTSILIAYAPCIEHGLQGGMANAIKEEKAAVESGYWPLYRFNPILTQDGKNPFILDSRKIRMGFREFLERENRFASLLRSNPGVAEELTRNLEKWSHHRHETLVRRAMDEQELIDSYRKAFGAIETGNRLLVLYGSETGNAEGVAKRLAEQAKMRKYTVQCCEADDFDIEQLPDQPLIVFVVSTAGQGEIPANAQHFYEDLKSEDLAADFLAKTKFAVFGLGDSSYAFYCKAAKLFDERLEVLGAERFHELGTGDDMDEDRFDTGLEKWLPDMWSDMGAPQPELQEGIPDAAFEIETVDAAPMEQIVPPGAALLRLDVNKRITPEDYDRDMRHMEFGLKGTSFEYNLGDALAIYAQNDPADVKDFLAFYKLNGDDFVAVKALGEADSRIASAIARPRSITQLFVELFDVFGRPPRHFYEELARFADDPEEKAALIHLMTPEGKEEYRALVAETVTFADILRKFPSAHPDLPHLLAMIPAIKPRYYSIASAQRLRPDRLDLCVVIVDWKTPSGALRYGTTTGYLRRLPTGATIACAIKPSTFTLPEDDTPPMLMAGLGTGMAPFRAFVEHRAAAKREGKPAGPMVLYYGCRHRATDFIYGDELEAYQKEGVLTELRVAFSRDQAYKIYVQNKVEEDPELVYKHLIQGKGHFFMCGQAGRTVDDIRDAVTGAISKVAGVPLDKAKETVLDLQIKGRYSVEAWQCDHTHLALLLSVQ